MLTEVCNCEWWHVGFVHEKNRLNKAMLCQDIFKKYLLQCLLHLLFVPPLPKGGQIVNFVESFL